MLACGLAYFVPVGTCLADEWTNVIHKVRVAGQLDRGLKDHFVPFDMHPYASLQQWVEGQAATAGLDTRFDSAAFQVAQHHVFLVGTAGFRNLPKRYFLGWMFHLFNLAGRVEDDTLVVIKSEKSTADFKCFQETDGPWRKQVDAVLQVPVTFTGTNCNAGDLLSFLSFKTDAPLLLDRSLMADDHNVFPPPLDRGIDLVYTNAPLAEVLSSVFKRLVLTYRLQGGVIFITTQENSGPNQVPVDTTRTLADPQH